jgi:anti-sigma regulatory factor (Ser/Thr protein kinase)/serine/threonine protein phosphatase PrpC
MPPAPQILEVLHQAHVGAARRQVKSLAQNLGFGTQAAEEITLAVIELATNLVKHARGGTLILTPLGANGKVGLEVESRDNGPGIRDINQALTDGFSTTGSLGNGLGAVNRLMDDMDIRSQRGFGTRIVCRKWVRRPAISPEPCPLAFGAASRPRPKCDVNGDAFVIKPWADAALVGIIDGLGHGQFAHRAAQTARQYVETHFDQPLEDIFRGVGRACRATRGVVMALARFDWLARKVALASIGNVEVRAFGAAGPLRFAVRRGIIGVHAPNPVVTEQPWVPENLMVLHSDGLTTHWTREDFPKLAGQPPTVVAQGLLRALAKDEDDATVLVVASAKL